MALMSEDKRVFFSGSAIVVNDETAERAEAAAARAEAEADRAEAAAAEAGGLDFSSRDELVEFISLSPVVENGTELRASGLSYVWQSGSNSIPDMPNVLPLLESTPDHYGCAGDDATDDTSRFRAFTTGPVRRMRFNSGKRYRLSGQQDWGRYADVKGTVKIRAVGSRNAPGASLNIQTGAGSQHIGFMYLEGQHTFDKIDVILEPDPTAPWLAILRNDFYARENGQRAAYPTVFYANEVKISAPSYVTGTSGNGNGCISMQAMESVFIQRLSISNFDNATNMQDINFCAMGAETAEFRNTKNGVGMGVCNAGLVGKLRFFGSESLRSFTPGANALVIVGCEDFSCGDCLIEASGEHGIRLTSVETKAGGTGNRGRYMYTQARFGDIIVKRPGGCGFKVASNTDPAQPSLLVEVPYVSMQSLYVEDAGVSDFDTGGTFTGDNHFGLSLQNVRSFACGRYETKRVTALYNGKHCILARQVEDFSIGQAIMSDSYVDAVFWNGGTTDANRYNISMNATIQNFGLSGGGSALLFNNPEFAGRVRIKMDVSSGPGVLFWNGATGTPKGFIDISGTHFGVTNLNDVGRPGSRVRVQFDQASWPVTSTGGDGYSPGDMLFCEVDPAAGIARNGVADVYLHPSSSGAYIAIVGGSTPGIPVGTKLTGVWRSLGRHTSSNSALVHKVGY